MEGHVLWTKTKTNLNPHSWACSVEVAINCPEVFSLAACRHSKLCLRLLPQTPPVVITKCIACQWWVSCAFPGIWNRFAFPTSSDEAQRKESFRGYCDTQPVAWNICCSCHGSTEHFSLGKELALLLIHCARQPVGLRPFWPKLSNPKRRYVSTPQSSWRENAFFD